MGVHIGGIECQGHFVSSNRTDLSGRAAITPEHVQKIQDQLTKFNRPIKTTECLFYADCEQGEADALRMFFPICFANPNSERLNKEDTSLINNNDKKYGCNFAIIYLSCE